MTRCGPVFLKVFSLFLYSVTGFSVYGTDQNEVAERVSILEEKIQNLTGQIEEISHALSLLKGPQQTHEKSNTAAPEDEQKIPTAAQGRPITNGTLPDDEVQDLYNKALSFLSNKDYDTAEMILKRILDQNKSHPLVINAQYWLGECYLQRQKNEKDGTAYLEKAMIAFADAYKSYRSVSKSPHDMDSETRRVSFAKAPEALLKLAITFKLLGRTKDACASLNQLSKEFPLLPQNLKKLKESTSSGLVCGKME